MKKVRSLYLLGMGLVYSANSIVIMLNLSIELQRCMMQHCSEQERGKTSSETLSKIKLYTHTHYPFMKSIQCRGAESRSGASHSASVTRVILCGHIRSKAASDLFL